MNNIRTLNLTKEDIIDHIKQIIKKSKEYEWHSIILDVTNKYYIKNECPGLLDDIDVNTISNIEECKSTISKILSFYNDEGIHDEMEDYFRYLSDSIIKKYKEYITILQKDNYCII